MSGARSEMEWGQLAQKYIGAGREDKTQLAIDVWQSFGGNPDARAWLRNYLSNPYPEGLVHPNLVFLLGTFTKNPTREDVALATKHWSLDNDICIDVTSIIIRNGKDVLSAQERKDYANKAKRMADEAKQRHLGNHYNYRANLVNLVADFEGVEAVDWLCKIIESEAISPTAGDAWGHALKFSPEKTAKALLINLKTSPVDFLHRPAWVVERVIPVMNEIKDESDLVLIIDTALRLATNIEEGLDRKKNWDIRYAKDYVREALKNSIETMRLILEKLPHKHSSRVNMTNLLKQLT